MKTLQVLEPYFSPQGHFQAGAEITVEDHLAEWFLNDAPGTFKVKGMVAPVENKMVESAPEQKELSFRELQAALKTLGLSAKGTKAELLERLDNA